MRFGVFSAAALALAVSVSAVAEPPLASNLPGEVIFYAGWAGRSLAFDGSAAGQLLEEPAVGELLAEIQALAATKLTGLSCKVFPDLWHMASIAWQHPMAGAILDISPEPMPGDISALILIELGDDRQEFAASLAKVLAAISEDNITVIQTTIASVDCQRLQGNFGALGDITIGFKGNTFFAAAGPETARQFVQLAEDSVLAANTKFAKCWQTVGGTDEQIACYVDLKNLFQRLDEPGPSQPDEGQTQPASQMQRLVDALGLAKAEAVASSTRIVEKGMYTKVRLLSPAPHQGLLMPLSGSPLTEDDLAGVPEDADFFCGIRMSPAAFWAELLKSVGRFDPKAKEALLNTVAELEGNMGLSISDDILASLSDTLVLSSATSQGGFLTGTVLQIPVKDPEKLSASINRVEDYLLKQLSIGSDTYFCPAHPKAFWPAPGTCPVCGCPLQRRSKSDKASVSIEKVNIGRTEIHYLTGTTQVSWPFAPAWAVHGDTLYLAGWPQAIASTIAQETSIRPIVAESSYRKARSKIAGDFSTVSYTNTPAIIRKVYNMLLVGWTTGANALEKQVGLKVRPDWLAPLPTMEKYLWPEITAVTADDEGIAIERYGSLPVAGLAFTPLTSAVSATLPSLMGVRASAKRAVSASNLHGIGQSLCLYASEHEGQMPPDLATLVSEGFSTTMLVSPASRHKPPTLVSGKLIGQSDYVYIQLDPTAKADMVMAHERAGLIRGGMINVLYFDGHVSRVTMKEFRQAMKRTKQHLRKVKSREKGT